jgi:hypothetical protein
MLSEDVKARTEAAKNAKAGLQQTNLDGHTVPASQLNVASSKWSAEGLRQLQYRWLIETDQVRRGVKFQRRSHSFSF